MTFVPNDCLMYLGTFDDGTAFELGGCMLLEDEDADEFAKTPCEGKPFQDPFSYTTCYCQTDNCNLNGCQC